jgi:hypothetical protein
MSSLSLFGRSCGSRTSPFGRSRPTGVDLHPVPPTGSPVWATRCMGAQRPGTRRARAPPAGAPARACGRGRAPGARVERNLEVALVLERGGRATRGMRNPQRQARGRSRCAWPAAGARAGGRRSGTARIVASGRCSRGARDLHGRGDAGHAAAAGPAAAVGAGAVRRRGGAESAGARARAGRGGRRTDAAPGRYFPGRGRRRRSWSRSSQWGRPRRPKGAPRASTNSNPFVAVLRSVGGSGAWRARSSRPARWLRFPV